MTLLARHFSLLVLLAFAAAPARAVDAGNVIYPKTAASPTAPAADTAGGLGATTILGAIVLAGAGGWMLWRSRSVKLSGRDVRSLVIDETRSLGNRQYLVVASYEGKKILLGVCPGRIDMLAPLSDGNAPGKTS